MGRIAAFGLLATAIAACAPNAAPLPTHPLPAAGFVSVQAEPLPLDPRPDGAERIGAFAYAGGVKLTSRDTARLHGLSDLRVRGDRLVAVSDGGDLLDARLDLDSGGRIAGLSEARISPLLAPGGEPVQGKAEGDAEGLAILADGARLVSFERDHRIWLYPAGGGGPLKAPSPDAAFPPNEGMEALDADPASGPDAFVVGGEASGETWRCRLSAGCMSTGRIDKPPEFGLVAAAEAGAGRTAWLLRAFDPIRGVRIVLLIRDSAGREIDRLAMAQPLTIDNFEGLAAVPGTDGSVRFYLLSDDNFSNLQRTLLMAFDWRPKT